VGHGRLGVDLHAGDPSREVVADGDGALLRRRADHRHAGVGLPAAVGGEQLDHAIGGRRGDHRVHPALVALARLGGQLVALAGAEHRGGVPVSGLDQDVGRGLRHLGGLPAHDAAEADDAGVVGDDEISLRAGGQRAVGAVEGGQPLALAGAADADGALELVGVVAVDRAADLEHHVVGDVHGQRDRAHPRLLEAARHPVRGGRCGVEAGDLAGDEDRAAGGVLDLDRVALAVGCGQVAVGGVVETDAVGERGLARDAAQRERVGAVGVDLELDDLLVEPEDVERTVAGGTGVGGKHDDAVVVLAQTELAGRADHARRDVPVGLACGDLEAAGQHPAGEHHDHQVAGGEVVGAADDALRLAGAVRGADVDGAPVDRLAVLLRLGLHRQHSTDHERAGDVGAGALDRLELEPERGQPRGEVLGRDVVGEVDVLTDPGDRGLHGVSTARFRMRW